jgi:hypothetical protein
MRIKPRGLRLCVVELGKVEAVWQEQQETLQFQTRWNRLPRRSSAAGPVVKN